MSSTNALGMARDDVAAAEFGQVAWHKSTFSNLNGNCVEVGLLAPSQVGVRDTKDDGAGPVLEFSAEQWRGFIAGVKRGEFDA